MLLNREQTLWCLLVAPMIPKVTPSGEKRMLVFPFHSHSISPDANVQACRLETCGLSGIGRNCFQSTGTRARLGIYSPPPCHQHTRVTCHLQASQHSTRMHSLVGETGTAKGPEESQESGMAPEILTWPLPTGATGHSTLGNTVAKTTGAEVPVHANLCPCKTRTLRWQ